MEFIEVAGEKCVLISSLKDVEELKVRISEKKEFAHLFKFSDRNFFISVLKLLKISDDEFRRKYYYYDKFLKLHVSESEFGYVWISTYGLIARKKATLNSAVNSCFNQYTVIFLLIQKAIEVCENENVYDIDSHNFGLLEELSPAIFHNMTFYIEVFCKSYLSLSGTSIPYSHKLKTLHQKVVETMYANKHNNSLFQIMLLEPLYKFVHHVINLPEEFKEHNIKYDNNPMDDTVILFDLHGLLEMKSLLELTRDFISEYYYEGKDNHFLESNLYQRLMKRAKTEDEKKRIEALYPHLKE